MKPQMDARLIDLMAEELVLRSQLDALAEHEKQMRSRIDSLMDQLADRLKHLEHKPEPKRGGLFARLFGK